MNYYPIILNIPVSKVIDDSSYIDDYHRAMYLLRIYTTVRW